MTPTPTSPPVTAPSEPAADTTAPDLAEGFSTPTLAEWRARATAALNRGRPPERAFDDDGAQEMLRTRTADGLDIEPLYVAPDPRPPLGRPGLMPFTRGCGLRDPQAPWDVRQWHADPDAAATRRRILLDLERGVTSVWLSVGPGGLDVDDVPQALADVLLDLAPVVVSGGEDDRSAADALLRVWADRSVPDGAARGNLGHDPLGRAARTGGAAEWGPFVEAVALCLRRFPGVDAGVVDARPYHDAGGGDVEEVGAAVATGIAYLRACEAAGIPPTDTARTLEFRVVASADQFLTIAKLRALRRLWARVGQACGIPEARRGARQHAVMSSRMVSRDDPWVNILRGTVACFSAAVGGAEAITVLPFDAASGLPDVLARRIARNTQVIVGEESSLGRVTDPAGGSWYVEALTDELAVAAWAWVQDIERAGGMAEALRAGLVADRIAGVDAERTRRLVRRVAPLTGVSTFPLLGEERLARPGPPATQTARATPGGLPVRRDSEIFEALRDRSAAHAASMGLPPEALLLCVGARREFGAREMFVANLLGVAGVAARRVEAPRDAVGDALTAVLAEQGDGGLPQVAVVCTSPTVNAESGREAIAALRAAGVARVYLAGQERELGPAEQPHPEGRGLPDATLSDGIDIVAALTRLLDDLGVDR